MVSPTSVMKNQCIYTPLHELFSKNNVEKTLFLMVRKVALFSENNVEKMHFFFNSAENVLFFAENELFSSKKCIIFKKTKCRKCTIYFLKIVQKKTL